MLKCVFLCSFIAHVLLPCSYATAYNEITIAILLHVIIIAAMHAESLNIPTEWLGNTAWDNHSVIHIICR